MEHGVWIMLLSRAVERIQLLMGNRSDLSTRAVAALQDAQDALEKGPRYPWFLISEEATIVTGIGERRVPLPTDYIADTIDNTLFYYPDDTEEESIELVKSGYEKLRLKFGTTGEGVPQAYAKSGLYYHIFPIPDELYTLKMKYYQKDTPISSLALSATNKWLTYSPDTIIGKAGMDLAVAFRDGNAYEKFKIMEQEGRQILTVQDAEQEVSEEELLMGGPAV
jgi:hypothetical protein